tara:strand:+ start:521 stop:877 length:357 start_codon:yes stop_codon:yes gene_type:complete
MTSVRDIKIKYISLFFDKQYHDELSDKIMSLIDINNTAYTINHNGIFINLNSINDILLDNIYNIINDNHIDEDDMVDMHTSLKHTPIINDEFIPTKDRIQCTHIDTFLIDLSKQHLTI